MFKKSLIIILFLIIPFTFITPSIYAQSSSSTGGNTQLNVWQQIWNWFFGGPGVQVQKAASEYLAKDTAIDDPSKNSEYNNPNFDFTTKMLPIKVKVEQRGLYLNQMIHEEVNYQDLSYRPPNCNSIKLSEMVYYFYSKGIKILYDSKKNLLDYDTGLMEKYQTELKSSDECYLNVYLLFPSVPQGNYKDQENTAAATSLQLDETMRMLVSISQQNGQWSTDDINNPNNVQKRVDDTNNNEFTFLKNMIPYDKETYTEFDSDREKLRDLEAAWLHPLSWQDDPPERDENTPLLDIDISLDGSRSCSSKGYCNGEKSHCRGMSQYGAYGMARSNSSTTYQDILKFYYGDIAFTKLDPNSMIKVRIDRSDKKCSAGQTVYLQLEQYLTALGEMPDNWGKTGGMEALKAQVIAARTYAYIRTKGLANSICNTASCQVFRCSDVGNRPYLAKAVEATAGIIIVDAATHKLFPTEYARSFCGSSIEVKCDNHTTPSVNANENIKYEKLGHPSNLYCRKSVSNI